MLTNDSDILRSRHELTRLLGLRFFSPDEGEFIQFLVENGIDPPDLHGRG